MRRGPLPGEATPAKARGLAITAELATGDGAAAKTWRRRLKGENQLPKIVQGVTFRNSVEVTNTPA